MFAYTQRSTKMKVVETEGVPPDPPSQFTGFELVFLSTFPFNNMPLEVWLTDPCGVMLR